MARRSGLTGARRPGAVTDAPGRRDNRPDQPRVPLDDDRVGQLSGVLLPSGIESAQARSEEVRIPAPVWMMRSDEIPASAPDFASLGFAHMQNGGHLLHRPERE